MSRAHSATTAPSTAASTTTAASLRTMQPINTRSRRGGSASSGAPSSTLAPPSERSRTTSITVIEPSRERYSIVEKRPKKSVISTVGKGAAQALGFCFYLLTFCCVLGADKPTATKKHHRQDTVVGPRIRRVGSSTSSKAGSEKIERVYAHRR